jgi:hypothetical protein
LDLRFSPDGTLLAATTDTGSVLIYDPSAKQLLRQWTPFGTDSLALDSLRFLNPFMAIVSSEGNLRTALLNLASGTVCQDISFVADPTETSKAPLFNVLDVHPASQTLFLGNSARASLLALHYTLSRKTQLLASSLSIDCVSGKIPAASSLGEESSFFGTFPI